MPRLLSISVLALAVLLPAGGGLAATPTGPALAANVFVSPSGSDSASTCARAAQRQPAPAAAAACRSVAHALVLAQPGDIVQLLPGEYGNLFVSRQSGADSNPVVVRGDPAMPDQFRCAADSCPLGNVTASNVNLCGHGVTVEDIDSAARSQSYVYVGDNSCPTAGGNAVTANHDLALRNVHFTQGTLRGTNVGMYHSRLGPEYDLCGNPGPRSDLLHIWPTGDGHEPVNVTVDHSVIYGNIMSQRGCGGAHADNIQVLGVDGLTFTNNIVGRAADDDWTDGSLNGTQEHGTIVIADNFFAGGDTVADSVGVQFGLNQDGSASCTANYVIEYNTFGNGRNVTLACNGGTAVWIGNYLHQSARLRTTCGSGTFDYNRWDTASGITCGTHAGNCTPHWAQPGANSADQNVGWDLHLSPADTCLRGQGPVAGSPPDATAVAITRDVDGDPRPLRFAYDLGADQEEPALLAVGLAIGKVALGMPQAAVEALYGPTQPTRRSIRGTATKLLAASYRVPGGTLTVGYDGAGKVAAIATSSSYYSTAAGVGVGSSNLASTAAWSRCGTGRTVRSARARTVFSARSPTAPVSAVAILNRSLPAPRCHR